MLRLSTFHSGRLNKLIISSSASLLSASSSAASASLSSSKTLLNPLYHVNPLPFTFSPPSGIITHSNLIPTPAPFMKLNLIIKSALALPIAFSVNKLLYKDEEVASCEQLVARFPNAQRVVKIAKQRRDGIFAWLQSIFQNIYRIFQLSLRCTVLFFTFLPNIVTIPLLNLRHPESEKNAWWWEMLRASVCSSGPSFIKLCQWIATRPDVFPDWLCLELQQLQSHVKPHKWSDTVATLESTFGPDWASFVRIKPDDIIGCGSVAQVFKGEVLNQISNRFEVMAIKILHPDLQRKVELDLEIMNDVAWAVESLLETLTWNHLGVDALSLSDSVKEFSKLMRMQINLNTERDSLIRFNQNFDASKKLSYCVEFPKPLPVAYVSREGVDEGKILIETLYQNVIPMAAILTNTVAIDDKTKKRLAKMGLNTILKMMFEDNFIHGDLHPGNILFRYRSDGEPELIFLDAGITTEMEPYDYDNFVRLFRSVVEQDGIKVANLMIDHTKSLHNERRVIHRDEYEKKMDVLIKRLVSNGITLGNIDVSSILYSVLRLCYDHRVKIESRYVSVILSLQIVEGLGRRLDPQLNLLTFLATYIYKSYIFRR